MKLGLKITSVAFALALLTACGGGGGGGGGGGNPDPDGGGNGNLQLNPGVDLTNLNNTEGANSVFYSQLPDGVQLPKRDVDYDLTANSKAAAEYPGFTLYDGLVGVDTTDDNVVNPDVMVQIYGIQYGDASNKNVSVTNPKTQVTKMTTKGNSSVVMLFDSSGSVSVGGAVMTGQLPSGRLTYRGYNFFRYTAASSNQQALQTGKFTFTIEDITDGNGILSSTTSSSVGSGTTTTTYAGTKIENQRVSIITSGDDAGSFQGDITIVPTSTEGTRTTDGTDLSARIFGRFHGENGVGIAGQYQDKNTNRMFHGAIVGDTGVPAPN